MTQVRTAAGVVRGSVADGVHSFRGIPYAAEPSGPLRFAAPAPPVPWSGIRDALEFGPAPPQPAPAPGLAPAWRPEDGLDCLTANVWTPAPGGSGLPVMVWLHGGRWTIGSAAMPQYDGSLLAAAGVVVVTLNYRLGFEGFGHLPGAPDNRGLLDQLAALSWVRENMAGFGGNPDNVTVLGHSAGAASAVLLMRGGLARRVVAQSVPSGCLTVQEAARVTDELAAAAGVPPSLSGFAGLEPVVDLPGRFGPVLDGTVVTGEPWTAVAPEVDLVCGFTHEEFRGFDAARTGDVEGAAAVFGLPPSAAELYQATEDPFMTLMSDALVRMPTTRVAAAHAAAGGRTWLYDFTWRGPLGAAHGVDVPFTFGVLTGRYAERLLGPAGATESAAALSAALRTAWTSFAATGDPGWPRYEPSAHWTRLWDDPVLDVPYPLADSAQLWDVEQP
ncbi:carboxylesterase/lipase family protein [Actinophytocola xanthii]|uniref:carboxylesterase/lipase family protein n=1 Tax=Actinophytocola xanthii TaxID=1912961 RepID=UPI001E5BF5D8|nr:carboxylesterase family protein [Actinophytocola xanthii]